MNRKRRKPVRKKRPQVSKKYVVTRTFNFDIDSLLKVNVDRLTGLELETPNQDDQSTDQISLHEPLYIVSEARPGDLKSKNLLFESQENKFAEPFDPSKIRVTYKEFPIEMILRRINQEELNLNPGFQRNSGVWTTEAQSRLIESLLIRIPIPVFYIDGSEDDKWLVIDGLQRLSTFKKFALEKTLKLKDLEFLVSLNGKTFDDLPKNLQRRILESTIGIYLIEKGTPEKVKISIFDRINTGGLPLSKQEIRHALFQGQATRFLDKLSRSKEFLEATDGGISQDRMADRECILRSLAFMITPPEVYAERNIDGFLNDTMSRLRSADTSMLVQLESRFIRSMRANQNIFGGQAFRKIVPRKKERNPINRSLFETWTVCLSELKEKEIEKLKLNREKLKRVFQTLLLDPTFESSISSGTGEVRKVQVRFERVYRLIKEVLK